MNSTWNPWNPWQPGQPGFGMGPGADPRGEFPMGENAGFEGPSGCCGGKGPGFGSGPGFPSETPFGPQGMPYGMPSPMGPRAGFGPAQAPDFGPGFEPMMMDPRLLLEELRKCGRGLQRVAEDLDGPDSPAQYKAHLLATRYLFYSLGLLFQRGIVLALDVDAVDTDGREVSRGNTCRAAGQILERFVRSAQSGRPTSVEMGEMTRRLRECWDKLTRW